MHHDLPRFLTLALGTLLRLRVGSRRKDVPERAEGSPLRGPVGDGEDDVREVPPEVRLQRMAKIGGGSVWIIPECAAAPCAENEGLVAIRGCDGKDAMNAPPDRKSTRLNSSHYS